MMYVHVQNEVVTYVILVLENIVQEIKYKQQTLCTVVILHVYLLHGLYVMNVELDCSTFVIEVNVTPLEKVVTS